MHPAIRADQNLRELALAEARNVLGPNEPLSSFLMQESITLVEYEAIAKNPMYQRLLKEYKEELTESGFGFSAKARLLAEDLLTDIYHMAKDKDTPAVMRVKTLEHLVDWGNLAPKKVVADIGGAGYSITINLPAQTAANTPLTVLEDIKTPISITLPSKTRELPDELPATHPLLVVFPPDSDAYYDAEGA